MNIVIVGQGAMGLRWYHHIHQLIANNVEYRTTQLQLLTSNSRTSNNPTSTKSASNQRKSHCNHYTFTDRNNLKHYGKINLAHTKQIQAADTIILCLKAFQISGALKEISNKLNSNRLNNKASIILAHNGMGILAELPQSIINRHNIYALLTTHGCLRTAPLMITHTGLGTTDIGLLSGASDLTQQQAITRLLNAALCSVTYHSEIKQKQWLKLAINCVINPLTAINNIENGQINNAEYQPSISLLLKEITTVANAEGIKLDLIELTKTVNAVAESTAKNSSSMRCDVLAKRLTEIDYINGYIHHLGTKHGIATPENTKMWQEVKYLIQ